MFSYKPTNSSEAIAEWTVIRDEVMVMGLDYNENVLQHSITCSKMKALIEF